MEKELDAVLLLTHNCLDLTKRCIESVRRQDVPTKVFVFDNGSSDGTQEWIQEQTDYIVPFIFEANYGVTHGWNFSLDLIFEDYDHCLVIGNDTVLAPWTYSALLSTGAGFVTGVDVGMSELPKWPDIYPLTPNPDFSCFLIRKECWDKIGPFDARMKMYVQDCDYHIRAHRAGVELFKACVPYNHERSSTMNRANAKERHAIHWQANKDRAVFKEIYGVLPGTPEYSAIFKEPCGQTQGR